MKVNNESNYQMKRSKTEIRVVKNIAAGYYKAVSLCCPVPGGRGGTVQSGL